MSEEDTKQDDEMICGLTMTERDVLQLRLSELPETPPPRAVWQRIEEQARAEGLLKKPGFAEPAKWFAGVGIAAAVVLAVVILPSANRPFDADSPETFATVPDHAASDSSIYNRQIQSINALMVQSRMLESDLRSLPRQPRVRRASTTATISGLQDSIAAIDHRLSSAADQLTPEQQEVFWRERVRLMESLVQLRYVQARRLSF